MQRRRFLATAFAASGVFVAGCLGDDSQTALDSPDRRADPDVLPFPAHGQELPEATLSSIDGGDVSTRAFVGERESLLTFVFTRCPGPCHSLTASLAHAQSDAVENQYSDEVGLFAATFDPEYDTADQFRSFALDNGADPDAENFHLLRPETPADAQSVIGDTFGVGFEEVPMEESDHADHADDGHEHDHEEDETTFVHSNLLLLVNRDGYVERAYDREPPRPDEVLDDLEHVRDEFA